MPITKGNRAIAARVRVTIAALAGRVPVGAAARPRLGAMATVAAPALAMIARPEIATVARVPVEIARPVLAAATDARVDPIAARATVKTPVRPVRRRALRPRS